MKSKSFCLAVLAAGLSLSAQGGKPGCTDAGVTFTVTVTDNNPGMSSDGNQTYANGVGGVIARLNCDGDSAELSGTRPVYLNLSKLLDGTAPAWTANPAPALFFNIPFGKYFNNPLPSPSSTFTTYLKVTMASPNAGYYFDMENPNADAPLNSPDSGVNTTTCTTTLVNVVHYAAGTYQNNPSAPETWVVSPDSSPASCSGSVSGYNVGTLLGPKPRGNGLETVGQFDVPFLITIQRQ